MIPILPDGDAPGSEPWGQGALATAVGDRCLAGVPWTILGGIACFPGSTFGGDVIEIPRHMLPHGTRQRDSARILELGCLHDSHVDPAASQRWEEAVRRSMIVLWLPRSTGSGVRTYKPSSWLSMTRVMLDAVRWQLCHRPDADGRLWLHLTREDYRSMLSHCKGANVRQRLGTVLEILREAGDRGALHDAPRADGGKPTARSGQATVERSPKGEVITPKIAEAERSFQPFPDLFTTQVLARSRWIQENLAEQVLTAWQEQRDLLRAFAAKGMSSSDPKVKSAREAALRRIDWRDAVGRRIERLPFKISQVSGSRTELSQRWPPESGATITTVVGIIQALNFCTIAFCSGARVSEIGSTTDDTIDPASHPTEPRLLATTFKLEDVAGGRKRHWPIHPVAARSIMLQITLARIVRPPNASHLWVLHGRSGTDPIGSPLLNLTEAVVAAIENLGLTDLAGKDRPHAHRWRHTIARLIGLALVDAPKVILDLLGHRDVETAIIYAMSDPDIAAMAKSVSTEVAAVLAEESVAEILAAEAGGPASDKIRDGLEELRMRRGEEAFGTDDIRELAEILTLNGRAWQLVRPGVICTKMPGQHGPCTKGAGAADPGSCRTGCGHRLERARARSQCSDAIEMLIVELEAATQDERTMLVANLSGQLVAQLLRWDDVRTEWLEKSETARRVWNGRRS